ncbi:MULTISPECIES: sensor histidine kinase [unclassified Rathayibacter]|uniref:sensor histidine kinase n=1 Tax=unclassified Rathayibacter TaxID=2609250 RepID=UPI00188B3CA3|nr:MULTISPECIES: histidine kinase [unclassified Rathayibacter]MBF4463205.1 hypothetical protein [Rathayibacter sp. VKM Ac-2879]MBF4504558.1 hypothetical protein [Rathayibacter sp. VKM Ac-2878]
MPTFPRRSGLSLVDVLVAAAFGGFWFSAEAGRIGGDGGLLRGAVILVVVLVIATSAQTPWIAVGATAALTTVALLLADADPTGSWPLVSGLVYAALRVGTRPPALVGAVLSVLLTSSAIALSMAEGPIVAGSLGGVVVLGLAVGHLYRLKRGRTQLLRERRALERNLDEAGRELSLISERSRIARDVHDIMAQSLSIVLAQADGAAKLVQVDPGRAEISLGVISDVARSSLVEVRMLIESIGPSAVRLDQPTMENLPQLLERFGTAGLTVGFVEEGERLALTAGQQLAVYRITQEALTNALRHSGDRPNAFVRLLWDTKALLLEIASRGHPGSDLSIGSGMGISGMKERAELAGGWLTAEESQDGTAFVVTASVPAQVTEVTA